MTSEALQKAAIAWAQACVDRIRNPTKLTKLAEELARSECESEILREAMPVVSE